MLGMDFFGSEAILVVQGIIAKIISLRLGLTLALTEASVFSRLLDRGGVCQRRGLYGADFPAAGCVGPGGLR